MTTHALAALVGPFELIALFGLLSAPVLLTVSYVVLISRFKKSRPELRTEEAKLLSELAQLEAESASERDEDVMLQLELDIS